MAADVLATLIRLSAIVLAVPAARAQRLFDHFSPRYFSELDSTIQGLLVFVPNLVLVLLGFWSRINFASALLKR